MQQPGDDFHKSSSVRNLAADDVYNFLTHCLPAVQPHVVLEASQRLTHIATNHEAAELTERELRITGLDSIACLGVVAELQRIQQAAVMGGGPTPHQTPAMTAMPTIDPQSSC